MEAKLFERRGTALMFWFPGLTADEDPGSGARRLIDSLLIAPFWNRVKGTEAANQLIRAISHLMDHANVRGSQVRKAGRN